MCFDPSPNQVVIVPQTGSVKFTEIKPVDAPAMPTAPAAPAAALPWFYLEAGVIREIRVNRAFLHDDTLKPFIVTDASTGRETDYSEVMILGDSAMVHGTKTRQRPGCAPETVRTAFLQTSAALAVR